MDQFTEYLKAFGMSMVPILELRGSLIYAAAAGLSPWLSYLICVAGNILPVPFLVLFVRPVFDWMKRSAPFMRRLAERMEKKAADQSDVRKKYEMLGLFILVAIPLPGTGAWTGSLVAAVLGMRLKDSFPMISLGVLAAGAIMTAMCFGVGLLF